jgi:radical SAM protein with 4Fe4S-binding SPASM domain
MPMKWFDLELSSPCNARCGFCPQKSRGVKRLQPFMDELLVDRITDEIGVMARQERLFVFLCGMGENLLNKPLVIRALERLQRTSMDSAGTGLVTNGSHLTEELLECEAFTKLDVIQVSFTGYSKDTYEELFKLDFDRVVRNVVSMNQRLPGKIYIGAIDLQAVRGEKHAFVSFWKDRGISVRFSPLHSRGGHIQHPEAYLGAVRPFLSCEVFDQVTFISSDGHVLSCCHDVTSQHVIGDCRHETLAEIMERKRELRRRGFRGFEICSKCTDFTLSEERPTRNDSEDRP